MWSARVVAPEELTPEERHLWRSVCSTNPDFQSPFFSYGFSAAASRAQSGVRVAVLERSGEIVGFFPFQYSSAVRRLLKSAHRVGSDMSDHCGIISTADFKLSPPELLSLASLSAFEFQDLSAEQERLGLIGQRVTSGLRLDLRDGGKKYWQNLKRSNQRFTSEVARGERKLAEKCGTVRFTAATTDEREAEVELSRVIRVKGEQYKRTIGKNLLDAKWRRAFLSEVMASRDDQCTAVLSTLYAGETWVASHLGIRSKSVLHYWFPVYNIEFARWSPGHILTKYLICSADGDFAEFDLGGYGDYKRQFRPTVYQTSAGLWIGGGAAGVASHSYQALAWRATALQSKLTRSADR